ncbi:dienelactone hydrolase family protein [Shewanella glacialipiscicola]|uniref:Carboxymethylenebutenolidase n=1 Tax=Shewanella glacialipiscicola TaxID=614069 RepID=A0ABQ6IZL6_9GAMM|nr:dienelactone hydrolase family protein [Shewanella glacialipiscicola]MCL1086956.1 dienelactone hydrolase family protein [Shewanella glacialipiscicola]MCU7996055.1 dienelactone hydrolase family protein [Shewanella glacialipiscicola]MCU8027308.1 dienelactone hydrolase family protein [Shewanella glacialipiscicola]GIU17922.1 carboxymethylenebutenolidase [Shewanella glacialipiscicola]GMA80939.1 carboxymethylenebutenolidase [Shewanella glacialipiscicola]
MLVIQETQDIFTPSGPMRTYIYRPEALGKFPSIIFYSEIFQQTAPIARAANILASHGFSVLVPEVFHELNPIGTVLAYDESGKDKGNADKFTKPLEHHDSDTQALVDFALQQTYCTGKIGSMGVCIGGHLAYRAALNPIILGAFCLYPTDIHSNTLPCAYGNDSLSRSGDIQGELVLVFGKQDPHVSAEGRVLIHQRLMALNSNVTWLEVNAQHAFMRDEGERYDAALALQMYLQAVAFFQRVLR